MFLRKVEEIGGRNTCLAGKDFFPEKGRNFGKLRGPFWWSGKTRAVRGKVDVGYPFGSVFADWAG